MSSDWYAKKLGQPQPQRREATPPVQFAPLPGQMPYQYQPPIPHPASQQHVAPQRFDIDQYWRSLDPNTEDGKNARRQALLNNPKAGPGNKAAGHCPNCGGNSFFPRRAVGGIQREGVHPAPQCYDCGYPLVQSGSVGGAGEAGWS